VARRLLILLSLIAWGSALTGAVAQGGRFSPVLDLLTHLAPLYVAVGAITLCFAAMPGTRCWMLAAPGLASVAAGLVLVMPDVLADPGPAPRPNTPGLKIVQFNAWGANRNTDGAVAWLLAQDADIIVLEESGVIGKSLTKFGRYRWNCEFCQTMIFSKNESIRRNGPLDWRANRPIVSSATFKDAYGEFTVLGVHFPWPTRIEDERVKSAALAAMVSEHSKDRLIIVGDFNSTPWSFGRRRDDARLGVLRRTRNLFSWPAERVSHNKLPAPFPVLPIDHIYAGRGWATVSVRRGPRLGSDHYPVVAVLAPAAADVER